MFFWWIDTSVQILLEQYIYNLDTINDTERFGKVSLDHIGIVKSLEINMMGIVWPLRAIMTYFFSKKKLQ